MLLLKDREIYQKVREVLVLILNGAAREQEEFIAGINRYILREFRKK